MSNSSGGGEKCGLEDELVEEYADDLSIGEGWITGEELALVNWDKRWPDAGESYRALFGKSFFEQLARIEALSSSHKLRIVYWFTG